MHRDDWPIDKNQRFNIVAPLAQPNEDHVALASITAAVRAADKHFERVGGSSRHWVRDCFLPELERRGLFVGIRPKPHPDTCPCADCT